MRNLLALRKSPECDASEGKKCGKIGTRIEHSSFSLSPSLCARVLREFGEWESSLFLRFRFEESFVSLQHPVTSDQVILAVANGRNMYNYLAMQTDAVLPTIAPPKLEQRDDALMTRICRVVMPSSYSQGFTLSAPRSTSSFTRNLNLFPSPSPPCPSVPIPFIQRLCSERAVGLSPSPLSLQLSFFCALLDFSFNLPSISSVFLSFLACSFSVRHKIYDCYYLCHCGVHSSRSHINPRRTRAPPLARCFWKVGPAGATESEGRMRATKIKFIRKCGRACARKCVSVRAECVYE